MIDLSDYVAPEDNPDNTNTQRDSEEGRRNTVSTFGFVQNFKKGNADKCRNRGSYPIKS